MNVVDSSEGAMVMGEVVNEDIIFVFVNVNAALVDGVGKVIDRFPCILFGAKVFPLDKPFVTFATSVVSMCDNFVDFPFLMLVAGVVNDDVRDWFFSVAIEIIFVRFEVGNRNNQVDFPCTGNIQFIGKLTYCTEDFEWTDSLSSKFMRDSVG